MTRAKKIELTLITILLILTNYHLAAGSADNPFIYRPELSGIHGIFALILHPLVHVSAYHLILDAGAFLALWSGINAALSRRITCMITSAAASFFSVLVFSPDSITAGFCGLSGIAHGLMAVFCLEMAQDKSLRPAALTGLMLTGAKAGFETLAGHGLFNAMHMGLCGTPVPASHFGGVMGGIAAFALIHMLQNNNLKSINHVNIKTV